MFRVPVGAQTTPVGASLLAIAVVQPASTRLAHRYREQAHSYRGGDRSNTNHGSRDHCPAIDGDVLLPKMELRRLSPASLSEPFHASSKNSLRQTHRFPHGVSP
ncbi:hypothetical protein C1X35_28465 [Pseudomonas sp. FW306-1C-G01A]|nr:hypothetical protein C1X56_27785 [Pseudomonas sp. GW101-1A09]PMV99346.1 hypothetical protein C1X50_30185 [Pseudomonas sp. MPR-TSA4]PMW01379.1 hypothetical protein C1X55_05780 [Pseudomonas sp. GW460-C8]PMW11181.1 hypothetical protein C1X40_28865 [Pseudomonas sp. GW456-11-11-14-TSB2]PMW11951.1 hypothetical protein C1X52_20265 [Pseudomonas sp. FW306-2-1A-C05A]PMW28542.1 hypothetical protein C1X45_30795 [Pseudomonas sp. GW460-7]PMW48008.1 hypothetical protein C1X41_26665 [Pseudomonas sp. GW460